jgi:PAS domain S-box-containing protein
MSKKDNGPEEALRSSERELRSLVEAIPALVWRAGPEGNIEYVNKRVLDYFGAPLSEVIGWGWMDKVHPDDVAFKVRAWLQNLESGKPHDVICRFRGGEGGYRWFEVRGEPLRANGAVLGWYGVLIDIDDRRRAEEALQDSEYKLRQIIETVPSLLWSVGPQGEQTQLNQRALDYIVCVTRISCVLVGPHSSIRMTFRKPQTPSLTRFRPEPPFRLCTGYVGPTANIFGIMPVVSLYVMDRDA